MQAYYLAYISSLPILQPIYFTNYVCSHLSRCSFSMMVRWANDGVLQANATKMLVNDGQMLINDSERLVNDVKWVYEPTLISPSLKSISVQHSLIWPSLRSCTDCIYNTLNNGWIKCSFLNSKFSVLNYTEWLGTNNCFLLKGMLYTNLLNYRN